MSDVTSFSAGVNDSLTGLWNEFGQLDPRRYSVFFEDFLRYVAGDWTITKTELGSGSAAHALTDGHAGQFLLTTDNASADNVFFQKIGESFRFALGKKAFFEARLQMSDSNASAVFVGLQITDATPLDVTDGIFFLKASGSTAVGFFCEKDNIQTSIATAATAANATWARLGFFWDGVASIKVYVNDVHVGTVSPGTTLPDDEDLTISFGIQTGAAAIKTATLDYIMMAMER